MKAVGAAIENEKIFDKMFHNNDLNDLIPSTKIVNEFYIFQKL